MNMIIPDRFITRFPGIKSKLSRAHLCDAMIKAKTKLRALRSKNFKGSFLPNDKDFHPLKGIVNEFNSGNKNEAVWLAFLVTHFGPGKENDRWKSIRLFYSKFGKGIWSWENVKGNPEHVKNWMLTETSRVAEQDRAIEQTFPGFPKRPSLVK